MTSSDRSSQSAALYARSLAMLSALGSASAAAVARLREPLEKEPLFSEDPSRLAESLSAVSSALMSWDDDASTAKLIEHLAASQSDRSRSVDFYAVARWVQSHDENDARAVTDCIDADPPEQISIHKVLSRAGSQKLVFAATWNLTQAEVVLKKFRCSPAEAKRRLPRELLAHGLSTKHPNIVQTHLLQNSKKEYFLVERRLEVLTDEWSARGTHEAANLLRDIGCSLAELSTRNLVHGDVKPDNIAVEAERYMLLDFGICRPEHTFVEEASVTGSLRTRAPELLLRETPHSYASDVWALGATVYNTIKGRYPLYEPDEQPPRASGDVSREDFEAELARRAREEWDRFVEFDGVASPLLDVLRDVLAREPDARPTSRDLLRLARKELSVFLRPSPDVADASRGWFSPEEEASQLAKHLPPVHTLLQMPSHRRLRLLTRLRELQSAKGIADEVSRKLREISKALDDSPSDVTEGLR